MMKPRGNLYVIAAPSGTGKTTLVKALVQSSSGLTVSISYTTRAKRSIETNGIDYFFIDDTQFQAMIAQNSFLEYAKVFNHYYGTSREWVEQTLNLGFDVILEIDWQGHQQIRHLYPDCISIFILPPSLTHLMDRLKKRNQDKLDIIQKRLADAQETVSHIHEFDYVIVNDDLDHALHELKIIVNAGQLLQKKQTVKFSRLIEELANSKEG